MIKLNRIQQNQDVITKMTDRISNDCIVSAKSGEAKKRLIKTIVEVSDIGTDTLRLQKFIDDAIVLASKLSTHEEDHFARCVEALLEASGELG